MVENTVWMDGVFVLKQSDLYIGVILGKGVFGSVRRGMCRLDGKVVDVAVKVSKDDAKVSAVFSYYYQHSRTIGHTVPIVRKI